MQTFLPSSSFEKTAEFLDRQRLGKQRVEAWQIYRCLIHPNGWQNHPAVKMWKGHEKTLCLYGHIMCLEWIGRGYKDTMAERFEKEISSISGELTEPWWFGCERFHSSHRAALLYKLPSWYGRFGWKEEPKMDYFWPSNVRE